MHTIRNIGKNPMHIGGKTVYRDQIVEVEELPENMTLIQVLKSEKPEAKPTAKKTKKRGE